MDLDKLEYIERSVLSLVVQALLDYWEQAKTIFREDSDQPQDIAEDITREVIASMGVAGTQDRLYGNVDVKKAIYVFLPDPIPVALMLDAKAEKYNGNRTASIQMSQTSMRMKQRRSGIILDEPGKLESTIKRGKRHYIVVTVIAKFVYEEEGNGDEKHLRHITVACIPNGLLQNRYNPTSKDTIWSAGRDAPTREEDFRVRVSYPKLKGKAVWRVQEVKGSER